MHTEKALQREINVIISYVKLINLSIHLLLATLVLFKPTTMEQVLSLINI